MSSPLLPDKVVKERIAENDMEKHECVVIHMQSDS